MSRRALGAGKRRPQLGGDEQPSGGRETSPILPPSRSSEAPGSCSHREKTDSSSPRDELGRVGTFFSSAHRRVPMGFCVSSLRAPRPCSASSLSRAIHTSFFCNFQQVTKLLLCKRVSGSCCRARTSPYVPLSCPGTLCAASACI